MRADGPVDVVNIITEMVEFIKIRLKSVMGLTVYSTWSSMNIMSQFVL